MSKIAIIPARKGSKGLKDKNIRLLNGKPLLAYSIEAAQRSNLFDVIHLSTDSAHYADIGRKAGAAVPFLRNIRTSGDTASSWDVVEEVLDMYRARGQTFDVVTLLQPTSPLRTDDDIKAAYGIFQSKSAQAVVSVCAVEHSPLWCNTLPNDLSMSGFIKDNSNIPRQQLHTYYRINGAIYMVNCDFLRENHMIYREGCYAYIMDPSMSIDIDTELDFDLAEFLMKRTEKARNRHRV